MTASMTIEALVDVARSLGFELVCRDGLTVPIEGGSQYSLLRAHEVEFDGTVRECSAFLMGWRDLQTRVCAAIVESTVSALEHSVHYLTNTQGSQRQAATALGRIIAAKVARTLIEGCQAEGPEKEAPQ